MGSKGSVGAQLSSPSTPAAKKAADHALLTSSGDSKKNRTTRYRNPRTVLHFRFLFDSDLSELVCLSGSLATLPPPLPPLPPLIVTVH